MAKKFITIQQNNKHYRINLQDLRAAHKKHIRNIPKIPSFGGTDHHSMDA